MSLIQQKIKISLFLNCIYGFFRLLKSEFAKSRFYNFLCSPSYIDNKYKASLTALLISKLTAAASGAVHGFLKASEKSFVCKKISSSYVSRYMKLYIILTLFFAAMLITHHNLWNNLYGVFGAVLLIPLIFADRIKSKKPLTADGLSPWLIIFSASVIGALFITPSFGSGLRIALFIFSAVVFMLAVKEGIDSKKKLVFLIYGLIAALSVMCVYAIFQYFAGVEADAMLTDIANNKGMAGRAYSTVENPNNFAEIIVLLIPFIPAMFFSSERKTAKAALAVLFVICVSALLLSYSRGSYVSFAISAVVFTALYKPKWLIPVFFGGLMLIPFLPDSILNRILSIGSVADTSNAYRVYLWDGVAKLIRHEGITGIGLGPEAFAAAYAPYASIFAANASHSHMLYLELFIELGAVGGISFFLFMFSALKKGFRTLSHSDSRIRLIITAAISAFCGIAFSSATEYIWFYPRVMYVFFIVAGVLLSATACTLPRQPISPEAKTENR